ncbi:hypothetical protein D3C75_1082860 [compost metagenome]
MTKRPTTTGALRLGLMDMDFAGEMFRQWFTAGNGTRCWLSDWHHFGLADHQLFKAQLELVDHRVQLLGTATELRAPQFGDHHFQALNLCQLGRDQRL